MLWIREDGLPDTLAVKQWNKADVQWLFAFRLAVYGRCLAFSNIKYKFINGIEKKKINSKSIPVHTYAFIHRCIDYYIILKSFCEYEPGN